MGADFRREAITMLESMGISVEFSHHEGGPGQQEIDLRYADALSTADNIMTFRTVIREVALSQGIWASFMPKPFTTHGTATTSASRRTQCRCHSAGLGEISRHICMTRSRRIGATRPSTPTA